MNPFPPIKHFLRKPAVILSEIAGVAMAGALGAVWPEQHVFQSIGFVAVAAFATASLSVVVVEQFHRVRVQWRQAPSLAYFQSAPFKTEFERPATSREAWQDVRSERCLGSAGSLVFHAGLLLLIVAGTWRALYATDAVVDLIEGETIGPDTTWSAQWPGVFGRPLRLEQPLTLEVVKGSRYADGNLRELHASLSAGEIAVNCQLHFGGSRIYLAPEFGPAALLEWNGQRREAVLLVNDGKQKFSGESAGPGGSRIFLHGLSERPSQLEYHVMRGPALLSAGVLGVGQRLALPGGGDLVLRSVPMWARLHASRDSALWIAYLGMILTMTGAAMMFCLIKVDFCVTVTPLGDRERVFVALKPQRFAPLFQERFEQFVREQREPGLHGRGAVAAARSDREPTETEKPRRAALAASVQSAALAVLFAALPAFTSGCHRVSQSQARQLVERYNNVVSEAYRRGDVNLIDPVVGPNEGRKLIGLIGVRLDLGLTLDSQLLSLEVTHIEQTANQLQVGTKEHWTYRDLQIGTGKQLGDASQDYYKMNYYFTNVNQTWLVDEIKFTAPPQVGRTNTPWIADRRDLPGATAKETTP